MQMRIRFCWSYQPYSSRKVDNIGLHTVNK